jgi:hypothetical protein
MRRSSEFLSAYCKAECAQGLTCHEGVAAQTILDDVLQPPVAKPPTPAYNIPHSAVYSLAAATARKLCQPNLHPTGHR